MHACTPPEASGDKACSNDTSHSACVVCDMHVAPHLSGSSALRVRGGAQPCHRQRRPCPCCPAPARRKGGTKANPSVGMCVWCVRCKASVCLLAGRHHRHQTPFTLCINRRRRRSWLVTKQPTHPPTRAHAHLLVLCLHAGANAEPKDVRNAIQELGQVTDLLRTCMF